VRRRLLERRSDAFGLAALGAAALLLAAAGHARGSVRDRRAEVESRAAMVRRLGLTDLCLFTEARYTRHPSQADRFTPFQDHPLALEHFPSGSVVAPPR
jgi:hypothetical protein